MPDTPFLPKLSPAPGDLSSMQVLTELPEHYLSNASASNYVALGVMYTLMGMATPEELASEAYLDKVLMGVFTALNNKTAELQLPAFEPPTPLGHPISSKLAFLVDSQISRKSAASVLQAIDLKFIVNYIFGRRAILLDHVGSIRVAGIVNKSIDYLRSETGKAFPSSTEQGGTWNYDAITRKALTDAGITDHFFVDEFVGWMLLNKLQPTSAWVRGCDETKGHLGDNFKRFLPRFISDFRSYELQRREIGSSSTDESGNTVDFFDSYSGSAFPGSVESMDEDKISDIRTILSKFREFLVANAHKYHSDEKSLVKILDLLLQGVRPTDIKSQLGLNPGPYSVRHSKICSAGQDFKQRFPEFASVIEPLLD